MTFTLTTPPNLLDSYPRENRGYFSGGDLNSLQEPTKFALSPIVNYFVPDHPWVSVLRHIYYVVAFPLMACAGFRHLHGHYRGRTTNFQRTPPFWSWIPCGLERFSVVPILDLPLPRELRRPDTPLDAWVTFPTCSLHPSVRSPYFKRAARFRASK